MKVFSYNTVFQSHARLAGDLLTLYSHTEIQDSGLPAVAARWLCVRYAVKQAQALMALNGCHQPEEGAAKC